MKIDFLPEDPVISGQRFALVTIVGPEMKQKCDTLGMKVRGVCDTLEEAKKLADKLMKIDNSFDIYTVEVGKFFPLVVDSNKIKNVEYQNQELNKLMKSYFENQEAAQQEWEKDKNERLQKAMKEGQTGREIDAGSTSSSGS